MSVLVVRVEARDIELCSDWLFQLGAVAIEERVDPEMVLVAGFGTDDAALHARSILQERWPCRLEDTGDESEWRDAWLRFLEPVQIGSVLIHAPWHDVAGTLPDLTRISIDPGRAFGSGHHPTTRLAIELLQAHVRAGDTVLDAGCGTGILAVVASHLGARRVVGVDLDHDILAVAQANADANHLSDRIELTETSVGDLNGSFDVVVANIVVGDLVPVVDDLVAATERTLIVTGFLEQQADDLIANAAATEVARRTRDGWVAAVLTPAG